MIVSDVWRFIPPWKTYFQRATPEVYQWVYTGLSVSASKSVDECIGLSVSVYKFVVSVYSMSVNVYMYVGEYTNVYRPVSECI